MKAFSFKGLLILFYNNEMTLAVTIKIVVTISLLRPNMSVWMFRDPVYMRIRLSDLPFRGFIVNIIIEFLRYLNFS